MIYVLVVLAVALGLVSAAAFLVGRWELGAVGIVALLVFATISIAEEGLR